MQYFGSAQVDLDQICAVSAETFRSALSADVDRYFVVENGIANDSTQIEFDALQGEEPELIIEGQIDLGEIVVEDLALGLEPYPRKPGASFESLQSEAGGSDAEEKPNPFAVLARFQAPE